MTSFFLDIQNDKLVVMYYGTSGGKVTKYIRDEAHLHDFFVSKANEFGVELEDLDIFASSSLDFPTEYTAVQELIDLCKKLRKSF